MDKLLFFLLKKRAHLTAVNISTTQIAEETQMSQQNVSRLLIGLEKLGKIERSKDGIKITDSGMDEISDLYASLKHAFEESPLVIEGEICDGLGEGAYYVSQEEYQKQFLDKLGFRCYPGTLNIMLDSTGLEKRSMLKALNPTIIEGWKTDKRTFGDLFAYKCKINSYECAIIIPVRTHHGQNILEVIADVNLREKLKKKTGDKVSVKII
ncbi:MAG: DUF120 domain-containing protein [Candidatus Micrarchaeota archaeon]